MNNFLPYSCESRGSTHETADADYGKD